MTTSRPALRRLAAAAVAAALLTAGCIGSGGPSADADETDAPDAPEPAPVDGDDGNATDGNTTDEPAPGPRSISHAGGQTTVDGHTTTVVALEWNHVENLLALGITPAGVANPDGYDKWVGTDPLPANVTDVGTRSEPSLETVAKLDPDLILAVEFRHDSIYEDLSEIAPTLLFQAFPPEDGPDQYNRMQSIFNRTAKATAHQEEGDRVIDEMNAHLDARAQDIRDAGKTGRKITLTQVFTTQDTPIIRAFADNSIPIQVIQRLGLENAWPREYEQYGFTQSNKEGMSTVEEHDFFYQAQPDDNPVRNEWDDDPIWQSYEFVREDRVYYLGAETWLFGGPLMTEQIADRVADAYTR